MKDIQWVDVSELGNFSAHLDQVHAIISDRLKFER
jgi:tRNA dimethylallyltransferase